MAREILKSIWYGNTYLKGYWRFEETTGTNAADSSENSHDGTASRTNILNNASGQFGNMAVFASASSDAISITDHADLKPTGAFSIGAWIKTSTIGAQQTILQSYSQNTNVAGILLNIGSADNKAYLLSGKNNGTTDGTHYKQVSSAITVTDGSWHFIVGVWDTAKLLIYIDGAYSNSVAWTSAPVYAATNYVRIGCRNNSGSNTEFFNGSIDDAFILNGVALSAEQIRELYEDRKIGESWPQSGLIGLWHLNGNSTDFSGNNYHLTNNNSVTFPVGKFGNAASFNGSNQYLSIADASCPNLEILGTQTWMCWINPSSVSSYMCAMAKVGAGNTNMHRILIGPSGEIYFKLQGLTGTEQPKSPNGLVTTSNWSFVAGVYDSSATKIKIFHNGNKVQENTASGSCVDSNGDFAIGRAGSFSGDYFSGLIDECRIENRAWTDQEIRHYYAWSKGKYL